MATRGHERHPGTDPDALPDLSFEEFRRRLGNPSVTVANALTAEQYAMGHIPGSVSLPLQDLIERAAEILPDRSAEIVFYCGGPG